MQRCMCQARRRCHRCRRRSRAVAWRRMRRRGGLTRRAVASCRPPVAARSPPSGSRRPVCRAASCGPPSCVVRSAKRIRTTRMRLECRVWPAWWPERTPRPEARLDITTQMRVVAEIVRPTARLTPSEGSGHKRWVQHREGLGKPPSPAWNDDRVRETRRTRRARRSGRPRNDRPRVTDRQTLSRPEPTTGECGSGLVEVRVAPDRARRGSARGDAANGPRSRCRRP